MTDVNERLREAARAGSEPELNALLREQSCDTSSTNENGLTALMWAVRGGHEACVQILLPVSDALAKDAAGRTALIWAAYLGQETCVRLLLPVSDALAKSRDGMTALIRAACGGHEECVKLLLPASDVFATDEEGWTASTLARDLWHESLAQFIEAYALSQNEQATIGAAASPGALSKKSGLRV